MNQIGRGARDRRLVLFPWVNLDRPNFLVDPARGDFYFLPQGLQYHKPWGKNEETSPYISKSIHYVKQGWREGKQQETVYEFIPLLWGMQGLFSLFIFCK